MNLLLSQCHHAVENASAEYQPATQPRAHAEETHKEGGQRQPKNKLNNNKLGY